MRILADDQLHKDRSGHYITIGAGGVPARSPSGDGRYEVQLFVPTMEAVNEHSDRLPGERESFMYGGQLVGVINRDAEHIFADLGQLTSVLSTFAIPDSWLPHFAFSKKVCASAFGGARGVMVRPAWARLPGSWKNSLTLMESAIFQLVFIRCGIPRAVPTAELSRLPSPEQVLEVDCIDHIRDLRLLKGLCNDLEAGTSHHIRRFGEVCESLKLPVDQARQLLESLTRGLEVLVVDEHNGEIQVAGSEVETFVSLTLGLLQSEVWKGRHFCRWLGKALFLASVHRPLLSILETVLPRAVERAPYDFTPAKKELEEIICFAVASAQAASLQKFRVSPEISRSLISPTGGFRSVAKEFMDRSLVVPPATPPRNSCAGCGRALALEMSQAPIFPCPRACGEVGCSIRCSQSHFEMGECGRKSFAVPRFGERFSGKNYPLTTAVALAGGAVQRPLDIEIDDNAWDYFSEPGKEALEFLEEDPSLRWRYWAPESFTFQKSGWRPGVQGPEKGKGRRKGPTRFRTEEQPWGVDKLGRDDQVKVRQENKMAKRSLKSLETADRQGGFAGLEHPFDSYLWDTEEVDVIRSRPGFMFTSWSYCCYGGQETRWVSLLHNSPRVHQALHCPRCHCSSSGNRPSDPDSADLEYPWQLCVSLAGAILTDLRALMIPPLGTAQFDLPHLLYNQIMGAARGLQSEDVVYKLVVEVESMVRHMDAGDEQKHLATFVRKQKARGSGFEFSAPAEATNGRGVLTPYPAFRWSWEDFQEIKSPLEQEVSVAQMVLILAELRRRAKSLEHFGQVYVNLVDCIVVATRSVFFTLALLGIFIYVFSIIFIQLTRDTTLGDKYFTRFTESMLTLLLDAVLPDLSVFMREIIDEGAVVAIVMFVFILLGSVTMMNMLVGVLVEVIKTVSEIEREQMEVSFVKKIFSDMITKLNLDADGDNKISKDEFDTLLSKPEAAKALLNIGVDVVGLVDYRDVLFGKEGDVELSFAEFMEAILELRGTNNAKVKDIVDLRKFLSQETGAIYELVATVTAGMDDDASSVSSFGHRAHSKRSASKINEEC
eukprot:s1014_g6.t1